MKAQLEDKNRIIREQTAKLEDSEKAVYVLQSQLHMYEKRSRVDGDEFKGSGSGSKKELRNMYQSGDDAEGPHKFEIVPGSSNRDQTSDGFRRVFQNTHVNRQIYDNNPLNRAATPSNSNFVASERQSEVSTKRKNVFLERHSVR